MIFEDPTRRRWHATLTVFSLAFVLLAGTGAIFVISLTTAPRLTPPPVTISEPHGSALPLPVASQTATRSVKTTAATFVSPSSLSPSLKRLLLQTPTSSVQLQDLPRKGTVLSSAFYVQSDPDGLSSLRTQADKLDLIFPDWYRATTTGCTINAQTDESALQLMRQNKLAVFPRFSNDSDGIWHSREFATALHRPATRSCLANMLATTVGNTDARGLNLDIEGLETNDRDVFLEFLSELASRLHTQNQLLIVDIPPASQTYDPNAISLVADGIFLMAYDEYGASSPQAGPLASEAWIENVIEQTLRSVPPKKLLLGIGAYGYDWTEGSATGMAQSLKFYELMQLAKDVGAHPIMENGNLHFTYLTPTGVKHDVWFLDALTAWNQYQLVKRERILGVGLWRLGSEDPRIWRFLGQATDALPNLTESELATNRPSKPTAEVYRLADEPSGGHVTLTYSDTRMITAARYETLPTGYQIKPIGQNIPDKTLVLAFNSEPDAAWMSGVLHILTTHNVPAVFFVADSEAELQTANLHIAIARGDLIGNQLQPFNVTDSANIEIELARTARAISAATERKSALFQPPNTTSPSATSNIQSTANNLGYYLVTPGISVRDDLKTNAQSIVHDVEQATADGRGHLLLLRDGGENHAVMLAALNALIPRLQKQGYRFAGLAEATGLTREQLMPPLAPTERIFAGIYRLHNFVTRWHWQWSAIAWLFFITNALSFVRILLLGTLVLRSRRPVIHLSKRLKNGLVSVLIPAFNEEKTIEQTISSVQRNTHTAFEILVINDGSTDGTADIISRLHHLDPRIRLINKANAGKAAALNLGFRAARGEIVITIDADTLLFPHTINELLRPFVKPQVDAVCGNVEVGNVHNLLTGFQALEYITTQNFDRRAFDELNCISVVPGATGAWRRKRVLEIGGYSDDTLTEDADVTLRLLESGGHIVYAPKARSRTEVPSTVAALAKQRLRWSFGTFQCLRKHAATFFHGTLGWIALPNTFFFQLLYPVLSPLGDAVFLWAVLHGQISSILSGYLLFLFMDLAGSLLAFWLEHKPKKLMLLVFIQRFFYRQFMYVIAFRSIFAILRGTRQNWNKLNREGSVTYRAA